MVLYLEVEQETDGRWLAEITDLPGVLAYGVTRPDAIARVQALALRSLADRMEHGKRFLNFFRSTFSLHDHMGRGKGTSRVRRVAADRLGSET